MTEGALLHAKHCGKPVGVALPDSAAAADARKAGSGSFVDAYRTDFERPQPVAVA